MIILTTTFSPITSNLTGQGHSAEGFLGTLPNGDIVQVFRLDPGLSGDHVGNGGYVAMRKKSKLTGAWSGISSIYNDQYDDRNIAGGVTSTGRIVVFFRRYNVTNQALKQGAQIDINFMYSDDGGTTWSPRTVLPMEASTGGCIGTGPMIYVPTKGYIAYGYSQAPYYQEIWWSADGSSWGNMQNPVSNADALIYNLNEACYAYVGNGRIIGLFRTENGIQYYQITSSDYGATWSLPTPTNITPAIWRVHCPLIFYDEPNNDVYVIACNKSNSITYIYQNKPDQVFNNPTGYTLVNSFPESSVVPGHNLYGYPAVTKTLNNDYLITFGDSWLGGTGLWLGEQVNIYELTISVDHINAQCSADTLITVTQNAQCSADTLITIAGTPATLDLEVTAPIDIPVSINMDIAPAIAQVDLSIVIPVTLPVSVNMEIDSTLVYSTLPLAINVSIGVQVAINVQISKYIPSIKKTSEYYYREVPNQYTYSEVENPYSFKEIQSQYTWKGVESMFSYTLGERKPVTVTWARKDGKPFTVTSAVYTFENAIDQPLNIDDKTTLINLQPTSTGNKYCKMEVELTATDPNLPVETHIAEPQVKVVAPKIA